MDYLHSDLTKKNIKTFYNVYNKLGFGFLEKVYENALLIELTRMEMKCEKQIPIKVYYDKNEVGVFYADIVVEEIVIIELKAAERICPEHENQLIT